MAEAREDPDALLRELLAIYDATPDCAEDLYDSDNVAVWERARQILGVPAGRRTPERARVADGPYVSDATVGDLV
jgi:hypothetical protein